MSTTPPTTQRRRSSIDVTFTPGRRMGGHVGARVRRYVRSRVGAGAARPNVRQVKFHPKQELKAYDQALANLSVVPTANSQLLNGMTVGSEIYQRVGRKVYMQSIHIRAQFIPVATGTNDIGRVILLYDEQPNGATWVISDILQDSNVAAGQSALSEINLANRDRFRILRDHQVSLPSFTDTAGVLTNGPVLFDPISRTLNIEWFVKLKNLVTVYNATAGGTIASISSGALYLIALSNTNTGQFNLAYHSRLRYYD